MTHQYGGGGGAPSGTAGGDLSGTYPNPTLAAGKVPQELGYVQVTANQTGINASVLTDLTGLSVIITVGTRPIIVEFYCFQYDSGATVGAVSLISLIDVTASSTIQNCTVPTGNSNGSHAYMRVRVNPSAGTRTYKVQGRGDQVTAGRMLATAASPAWLRVSEV